MASRCSFERLADRACAKKAPDVDAPTIGFGGIRWFWWCGSEVGVIGVILVLTAGISFLLHQGFPEKFASPVYIKATLQDAQKFLGSLATFLGLLAAGLGFFLTWLDTAVDRTANKIMRAVWQLRHAVVLLEKGAPNSKGEVLPASQGIGFWRREETLERLRAIVGQSHAPPGLEGWEKEHVCKVITTIRELEEKREQSASERRKEAWSTASSEAMEALLSIYYGMMRLLVHRHIAPRLRRILRRLTYLLILMSGFIVVKIFASGIVVDSKEALDVQGWWWSTGIVALIIGIFVVILCIGIDFLEIVHLQGHLTFLVLPLDSHALASMEGKEGDRQKY